MNIDYVDGKGHTDANGYLNHIRTWLDGLDQSELPHNDHVMVFTGYVHLRLLPYTGGAVYIFVYLRLSPFRSGFHKHIPSIIVYFRIHFLLSSPISVYVCRLSLFTSVYHRLPSSTSPFISSNFRLPASISVYHRLPPFTSHFISFNFR